MIAFAARQPSKSKLQRSPGDDIVFKRKRKLVTSLLLPLGQVLIADFPVSSSAIRRAHLAIRALAPSSPQALQLTIESAVHPSWPGPCCASCRSHWLPPRRCDVNLQPERDANIVRTRSPDIARCMDPPALNSRPTAANRQGLLNTRWPPAPGTEGHAAPCPHDGRN